MNSTKISLILIISIFSTLPLFGKAALAEDLKGTVPEWGLSPSLPSPIRAELVADVKSIQPGTSFRLGVWFEMDPPWHIYYKDPGDSGLPTQVEWNLPKTWQISELSWPQPQYFSDSGMTTVGYEKQVLLWSTITVPPQYAYVDEIELRADVSWLGCNVECVPGSANLSLNLPLKESSPKPSIWAKEFPSKEETLFAQDRGSSRPSLILSIIFAFMGVLSLILCHACFR